ncbi:hypothetical protein BHE74_00015192 [Ensete ventricosum]|nr:hypothetical protein GW17_00046812 [Ensete ventricosum]RWW76696.1 hypothetical protein BHE74_00015192 [Ensete ventricosum]RZR80193.1 hypothetical protein BHM03_00006140 [Ensete ventricosum]
MMRPGGRIGDHGQVLLLLFFKGTTFVADEKLRALAGGLVLVNALFTLFLDKQRTACRQRSAEGLRRQAPTPQRPQRQRRRGVVAG